MMRNAVAYYRVSTERQGKSGLGLEAQQKSVRDFAINNDFVLINEFTEIETGTDSNRPVLKAVILQCKKEKELLLIATQDRLARSVLFISNLLESKVDFIVVETPNANKVLIQVKAIIDENVSDQISAKTIAALAAAKQRGVILGKYGREVLSKINKARSIEFALSLKALFEQLEAQGFKTIRQKRDELNRLGIPTYHGKGKKWHLATVHNVIVINNQINNQNHENEIKGN